MKAKRLLLLLGVLVVVAGFFARAPRAAPPPPGMRRTEGRVLRFEDNHGLYGSFPAAVIQFNAGDRGTVVIRLSEPSHYRIGESVPVNYDPDIPDRDWSISAQATPVASWLLIGCGAVLIVIAVCLKKA